MAGDPLFVAAVVSAALLAGLALRLPFSLSRSLAMQVGMSEARAGLYSAIYQFLLVPLMAVAGLLLDRWGAQSLLLVGALLAALGIAALEFVRSRSHLLPVYLVVAAGAAGLGLGSIVSMPAAFFPHREVASANLGFIALGLGLLASPKVAGLLQGRFGFRRGLQLLAFLCLIPALPAMLSPNAAFPKVAENASNSLADSRLWLAALLALLYQPLETSLRAWTPGYFKELGYAQPSAPLLWGSCWAVLFGARLLMAVLVQPGIAPWIFLLFVLLTAITLGNLLGAYRPGSGGMGLLLVGFCFGPLYPTVIGLVLQMAPAHPGSAVGVVLASGALGSLCFPPLIDFYARRTSARLALRIPLGIAVAMLGPALVLALLQGL